VYRRTIELLSDAYTYADVLARPSKALQLFIMTNNSLGYQFAGRMLFTLDGRERKFAESYIGLREHIQKMRAPLGAAGFRSVEAFESLQAQKGSILMDPEISRGVLRNSIKTFLSLQGADSWSLKHSLRKKTLMDVYAPNNKKMQKKIQDDIKKYYDIAYGEMSAEDPAKPRYSPEDQVMNMYLDGYTDEDFK
jgi:hypothetical protein